MDKRRGGVYISRNNWLQGEIRTWLAEGLITEEQAGSLSERYPERDMPLAILLPVLGAILLGIGIILFFAANWPVIPALAKLLLILAAFTICQHYAYIYRYQRNSVWLGSSLLLLGGILFGAAIFLIAQIYNISAYYPNGILFWGLGVVLMAWVSREKPLTILAVLLLLAWTITAAQESAFLVPWLHLLILAAVVFPVAYRSGSAIAVFLSQIILVLIVVLSVPPHAQQYIPAYLFFLGSLLFLKGAQGTDPFHQVYTLVGLLLALTTLLISSFGSTGFDEGISSSILRLGAAGLIFIVLGMLPGFRDLRRVVAVTGSINLLYLLVLTLGYGISHLMVYLILFFAIVQIIIQGTKQHKPIMLNTGLAFFYLTVIRGYFDYGTMYMQRSLFFMVGGILLLLMGWWLNRQREKIVAAWREEI